MKKIYFPMLAAFALLVLFLLLPISGSGQRKQSTSCIECHEGLQEAMVRPVALWRQSIHAANGVSCAGCHGGNPDIQDMQAMSPKNGFLGVPKPEGIPDFCGRCHPGVKEDYLASAHGRALAARGPQCVTCHGSHAVERASLHLISPDSCTRCHGFERAAEIREALSETDDRITALEQRLQHFHRMGIDVNDLRGKLFESRNTFHRLFHSVDVKKVRTSTGKIQSRIEAIREQAESIDRLLDRRKQAGAVVVGLLLLVTFLFFYLRHAYKKEESKRTS
jgi:hypothetical protein